MIDNIDILESVLSKRQWENKIARDERYMPKDEFLSKYHLLEIDTIRKDLGDIVGKLVRLTLYRDPTGRPNENGPSKNLYRVMSTTDRIVTLMKVDEATGNELYPISINWQDIAIGDNVKLFHII